MSEAAEAIVVGAGPAGLAVAAAFKARGIEPAILEKADAVGAVWRRHYDRLHLHTDRGHSGLPGLPIPKEYGRYPARDQVVAYLESYARKSELHPVFGAWVREIRRAGGQWRADAGDRSWSAPVVVVATGYADFPHSPTWPGMETFGGDILHSSRYRNPAPFAGKRVLVVGFGNSGGEIALDLAEAGIDVTLSVRGPVRILPREMLGRPILSWTIPQRRLPARLTDFLSAPLIRLHVGSVESLGMIPAAKGPRRMVEEDGRVPLLDVGTLKAIRAGRIKVRGDLAGFEPGRVRFAKSEPEAFGAVILATGFHADLRPLLPDAEGVLNAAGRPYVSGRPTAEPGLFFCGAITVATGQLREFGIEAGRIAEAAAAGRRSRAA